MNYRADVFATQYILVDEFARHLVYYRAIHTRMSELGLKSAFWAACANSNLFQASIKWCGVFGSKGTNQAHWQHLTNGNAANLQSSFRAGLYNLPGVNAQIWQDYWREMTDFRNNFAAHRSLKYSMPVPSFDLALEVAYYYDSWVRGVISPDSLSSRRLKFVVTRVATEARLEIEKAIPGI